MSSSGQLSGDPASTPTREGSGLRVLIPSSNYSITLKRQIPLKELTEKLKGVIPNSSSIIDEAFTSRFFEDEQVEEVAINRNEPIVMGENLVIFVSYNEVNKKRKSVVTLTGTSTFIDPHLFLHCANEMKRRLDGESEVVNFGFPIEAAWLSLPTLENYKTTSVTFTDKDETYSISFFRTCGNKGIVIYAKQGTALNLDQEYNNALTFLQSLSFWGFKEAPSMKSEGKSELRTYSESKGCS
jgi:hypothetical protein